MRISMHPGQYTVLNAVKENAYQNCLREIRYHSDVMDAMGLPDSDKIQIHVGGVYDDKVVSMKRFIARYSNLDVEIKRRLVIENDERQYNISDCKLLHDETGVPILLDVFHHQLNNNDISITEALFLIRKTWGNNHGIPMVDYSQSGSVSKNGVHAESIDIDLFRRFINKTTDFDFDIMLEIKDKELSAIRALEILRDDRRLNLAQNRVC
jgi:UV DNA damage endonuclease